MPRFGLSFSESFDRVPKGDAYGRRLRDVSGLRIVPVRQEETFLSPGFLRVAAALAAVAAALVIWRLFSFPH